MPDVTAVLCRSGDADNPNRIVARTLQGIGPSSQFTGLLRPIPNHRTYGKSRIPMDWWCPDGHGTAPGAGSLRFRLVRTVGNEMLLRHYTPGFLCPAIGATLADVSVSGTIHHVAPIGNVACLIGTDAMAAFVQGFQSIAFGSIQGWAPCEFRTWTWSTGETGTTLGDVTSIGPGLGTVPTTWYDAHHLPTGGFDTFYGSSIQSCTSSGAPGYSTERHHTTALWSRHLSISTAGFGSIYRFTLTIGLNGGRWSQDTTPFTVQPWIGLIFGVLAFRSRKDIPSTYSTQQVLQELATPGGWVDDVSPGAIVDLSITASVE